MKRPELLETDYACAIIAALPKRIYEGTVPAGEVKRRRRKAKAARAANKARRMR